MSLMGRVKIAYDLGCRMAVADMEKVSFEYPHSVVSDSAVTGAGIGLGELSGDFLSSKVDNETLKAILPYLSGAAGGLLGYQAIRGEGPQIDHMRQGGVSAGAQIASHLGARGLGAGMAAKLLSGSLGGGLGYLAENAKIK